MQTAVESLVRVGFMAAAWETPGQQRALVPSPCPCQRQLKVQGQGALGLRRDFHYDIQSELSNFSTSPCDSTNTIRNIALRQHTTFDFWFLHSRIILPPLPATITICIVYARRNYLE